MCNGTKHTDIADDSDDGKTDKLNASSGKTNLSSNSLQLTSSSSQIIIIASKSSQYGV